MTTHHNIFSRITTYAALLSSVLVLGSCTKHVTQVVDQNFSAIYKIVPSDWLVDPNNTNYFYVDLNVQEVDDAIFNNGGVAVYAGIVLDNQGNPTLWDALPESISGTSYNVYHSSGVVTIGIGDPLAGQTPAIKPTQDIWFKVVITDATPL